MTIYTVGHSNHDPAFFLELLRAHGITCIVDVRSVAASAYNPQYNKEALATFLKDHGVAYLHFAREFGARHTDPALLDREGRVDFEKVRAGEAFRQGVERLRQGLEKGYVVALMCSEAEPFDCHRFSMISGYLENEGFEVKHILKDKSLKSNAELENQLLKKYEKKLPKPSLLEPDVTPAEQLAAAYRLRNKDVGYSTRDAGKNTEQL